jgi:hypothetical protein
MDCACIALRCEEQNFDSSRTADLSGGIVSPCSQPIVPHPASMLSASIAKRRIAEASTQDGDFAAVVVVRYAVRKA